jgi:methanogenic corrinoid protein MtbC1
MRVVPPRDERRHDLLKRTVEAAVIPRLLVARRDLERPPAVRVAGLQLPTASHVADFVELLLGAEQPAATGFVEAMRDVGTSIETLYLDLLTPAARRLGVMWEEDLCDFAEVTIGLVRLHQIMRALTPAFVGGAEPRHARLRALLVQTPGEQHGLGLAMVVQFFTRAGWDVLSEPVSTNAELIDLVRHEFVSLIGISISCSERLDALAANIRAIRRASCNRLVGIMVGGPIFIEHPQLAAMVGADATAVDARDSVLQAQRLVSVLAREQ